MKTLFVFMISAIILVMLDQCQCDPSPQSITLLQTDSEAAKPIGQRIANGMSIIGHDISALFSCPDEVNGRCARCWWNKRGVRDDICGNNGDQYSFRFGTCYCCYR